VTLMAGRSSSITPTIVEPESPYGLIHIGLPGRASVRRSVSENGVPSLFFKGRLDEGTLYDGALREDLGRVTDLLITPIVEAGR